eukprot:Nitzschia sp. Nitz4//scaffold5_size260463//251124//251957//NITZ4_001033-RA/size260463-augustus-gene-0.112-mRNA-1//-1//CDS//3329555493//9278//frame0
MSAPPTDAQWQSLTKIVQSFIQRADCEPFRVPVDWKAMGLFDYPQIIKKPMDLGTVKKKIAARKYSTLQEAADDVRQVWTNCMTYNADGSDFYLLAQLLNKKWEEKFSKFLADNQLLPAAGPTDPDSKVSLEDKKAFAKSLFKISKEDLGKVIVEVDTKCPQAILKNAAEDECELNVDKLTPTLLGELRAFIETCTPVAGANVSLSGQPPKKKKK